MLTPQVGDVVHGVVEVGGVAACTPAVPGSRIVAAGHADREREEVGALEGEVGRVKRAEAAAARDQLAHAAAVLPDERDHLVEDPGLVGLVTTRALLERDRAVRPRFGVRRVDAVELHPAAGEQLADRPDHPAALEFAGVAALGGEGQDRATPVAVRRHAVHGGGHRVASRRVRWGCSASRQQV